MVMAEVTKEQFDRYEEVRVGGRTNMFDVRNVELLSGLDRKTIYLIMDNYRELADKYTRVMK